MKNLINVDIKAGENTEKLIDIISVLVKTQDNNLKEECDVLVKTKCDHDTIKRFSDERTFLSMVGRNKVVLATLMACCNISNPDLSSVDDSKINGLCVAYKCFLNTRNKIDLACSRKESEIVEANTQQKLAEFCVLP